MKTIYVSIGIPDSNILIANKVMCNVADHAGQTDIQVAKLCRKAFAEQIEIECSKKHRPRIAKPSELFWMVFQKLSDSVPYLVSKNTPCLEN